MTKQLPWILALTAALAVGAGCKKDEPAAPAAGSETVTFKPVKPETPAAPAQSASGGDGEHVQRGEQIDQNGSGVVSEEDRTKMLTGRAEMLRKRLDTDGDGKLTPAELGAARGRMHFDDPASLDTNHDGDISADELVVAMKARAELRRARHAGSGGSGTADGAGAGGW